MFKEIKNYSYIATVYYTEVDNSFIEDVFDFSSMIFSKHFVIDTESDINEICNHLMKEYHVFPVAVDIYFSDMTIDSHYRVEQKYNKMHFVKW